MAKTAAPREPLLNRSVVVALASAAIGIAVAAGLPVSDALREAILYAVGVAAPLALAWWARRHVTPAPPKELPALTRNEMRPASPLWGRQGAFRIAATARP